ncbi:MAG: hypothetical protein ACYDGR_01515 [Candidatus Dormibacteria bacterium]
MEVTGDKTGKTVGFHLTGTSSPLGREAFDDTFTGTFDSKVVTFSGTSKTCGAYKFVGGIGMGFKGDCPSVPGGRVRSYHVSGHAQGDLIDLDYVVTMNDGTTSTGKITMKRPGS